MDGPDDVTLAITDGNGPNPAEPANFRVTSEKGKTTFHWDHVGIPCAAERLRYDILVQEPGGSEDDWKFMVHTEYMDWTTDDDRSPLMNQRLPVVGTYEFAIQAVAVTPEGSPHLSGLAGPVTHTVRGPNLPWDVEAMRTENGVEGPVKQTWERPLLYPNRPFHPPAMPIADPNAVDTSVHSYAIYRADAPPEDGDVNTQPDDGAVYSQIAIVDNVTTYIDDTVAETGSYFYRVQARSTDGDSYRSGYAFAYGIPASDDGDTSSDAPEDPPSAPQNLAATAGADSIALTWDASAGAESYRVLRRNQEEALYAEVAVTTTNSYTDTTAVVAQGYAYKVQAQNDSGDSEFSDHVLAMIIPPAPDAPTGFAADVGDDSVTLSWDASDDDTIQGYIVDRVVRDADPPARPVLVRHVNGETTQVVDSRAQSGAAYTYSITAINAGGRSDAATVDVDIPAATGGLTVTRSGPTFNLSWDEVDGATSYNVLRMGPGETEHSKVATSETNSYTDYPSGSGTFSYRIQPVEDGEAAEVFAPVSVEMPPPPDPPTNLQAAATSSSVTISWTAPSQTLLTYLVSRKVGDAYPPEEFAT